MNSVDYYNTYSIPFYERTIDADLSAIYAKFLDALGPKGHILDAGCGVGRDSKYFRSQGYTTVAFDASEAMVRLASNEIGDVVAHKTFQEIDYTEVFDGIWASASLIHVPYHELRMVLERLHKALKPGGIFYASIKYGSSHRFLDERDFYDHDETTITPYLEGLFEQISLCETPHTHIQTPSSTKSWLNIFCQAL